MEGELWICKYCKESRGLKKQECLFCKENQELIKLIEEDAVTWELEEQWVPSIMRQNNYPAICQKMRLDNYQGDVPNIDTGLIFGDCGVGKTHLAIGLLRRRVINEFICIVFHKYIHYLQEPSRLRLYKKPLPENVPEKEEFTIEFTTWINEAMYGCEFITTGDLIWEMGRYLTDESKMLMDKLCKAKYLLLDDLGSECDSERSREVVNKLLFSRYNNSGATLITSNLNMAKIAERYGNRLASRITDSGIVIELTGKDRRLFGVSVENQDTVTKTGAELQYLSSRERWR